MSFKLTKQNTRGKILKEVEKSVSKKKFTLGDLDSMYKRVRGIYKEENNLRGQIEEIIKELLSNITIKKDEVSVEYKGAVAQLESLVKEREVEVLDEVFKAFEESWREQLTVSGGHRIRTSYLEEKLESIKKKL